MPLQILLNGGTSPYTVWETMKKNNILCPNAKETESNWTHQSKARKNNKDSEFKEAVTFYNCQSS